MLAAMSVFAALAVIAPLPSGAFAQTDGATDAGSAPADTDKAPVAKPPMSKLMMKKMLQEQLLIYLNLCNISIWQTLLQKTT